MGGEATGEQLVVATQAQMGGALGREELLRRILGSPPLNCALRNLCQSLLSVQQMIGEMRLLFAD